MRPYLVFVALFLGTAPALAGPRCVRTCHDTYLACRRGCAALHGDDRRSCVTRCGDTSGCPPGGARIRTLAYVVTTCEEHDRQLTGKQEFFVRRGDCDPVKVREYSYSTPVSDPFPVYELCPLFGLLRWGTISPIAGVFQRIGVSPKGGSVVFEVARHTTPFTPEPLPVPSDEQGMFVVSARSPSATRRVGDHSREPSSLPGLPSILTLPFFVFTPDGRTIAFPDRGPGPDGQDAVQIASLDLVTGTHRLLTRLPLAHPMGSFLLLYPPQAPGGPSCVSGATNDQVTFFTTATPDPDHPNAGIFSVGLDGSGLKPVYQPPSGDSLLPAFEVIKGGRLLATLNTDGVPKNKPNPVGGVLPVGVAAHPSEIFIITPSGGTVQLTNLGRSDTDQELVTTDGRVVFHASANGAGPDACQLFSVGSLGGTIRQLTHFPSENGYGCYYGPPGSGCTVDLAEQDPVTKTIIFYSTCDPFGTNPNGGQLFAMRPDGSGLRQVTHTAGIAGATVQLPGPFGYSGAPSARCQ